MSPADTLRFATRAALGYPLRTALMVLAMSIGVAAVVMLTALGDGARRYVVDEFSALGANLLIVLPGRTETGGVNPGSFVSSTPHDLTNDDATALQRLALVQRVAPLTMGNSEISVSGRLREVPWYSFFTWGFKSPREWWTSFWYEGKEYQAPTAMVDLSKPDEIQRNLVAQLLVLHELKIKVLRYGPSPRIIEAVHFGITAA